MKVISPRTMTSMATSAPSGQPRPAVTLAAAAAPQARPDYRRLGQEARDAEDAVVLVGVERPKAKVEDAEVDHLTRCLERDKPTGDEQTNEDDSPYRARRWQADEHANDR